MGDRLFLQIAVAEVRKGRLKSLSQQYLSNLLPEFFVTLEALYSIENLTIFKIKQGRERLKLILICQLEIFVCVDF